MEDDVAAAEVGAPAEDSFEDSCHFFDLNIEVTIAPSNPGREPALPKDTTQPLFSTSVGVDVECFPGWLDELYSVPG